MSRTISAALQAHLDGGATTLCTCWKIKRVDGVVMGFTEHDLDISFDNGDGDGSVTYLAASGYSRSAIQSKADLSVDNLDVDGVILSDVISDADLRAGVYDFAQVRVFSVNWADLTMGAIKEQRGWIGPVAMADKGFKATLVGLQQALSRNLVRVYLIGCDADLFDSRCNAGNPLNPASFTETGVVTSVLSSNREFIASITGNRPAGFFDLGRLEWVGTGNENASLPPREVKSCVDGATIVHGTVTLFAPTGFAIHVGDNFTIRAGCDKSSGTCLSKFNNIANHRGFPTVPGLNALFSNQVVSGSASKKG